LGSVFSPYYAFTDRGQPLDHAALNVAIYGRGGKKRWAMTERGKNDVERSANALRIGPSALAWSGGCLEVQIAELGCPVPAPIRGRLRLTPHVETQHRVALADDHVWWPVAPRARVELELEAPRVAWTGHAYHDCNWGRSPLESTFRSWSWSRAPLGEGAAIFYDVEPRAAPPTSVALHVDGAGRVSALSPPAVASLPSTLWRIPRTTRSDGPATVVRTLEDTPFYARSLVRTVLGGTTLDSVHESLSLDRFQSPVVRAMLPFRMPRWAR
jgi:carotenoid 1,2-hydratase